MSYSYTKIDVVETPANAAVERYSREPIDKPTLLAVMQEKFGLQYK